MVWNRKTPLVWLMRTRNSNCGCRQWNNKHIFEMVRVRWCLICLLSQVSFQGNVSFSLKIVQEKCRIRISLNIRIWCITALNETLKEEVQRLKIAAGQVQSIHGNFFNRGPSPSFYSHSQPIRHFGLPHNQQQLIHESQSSSNNQASGGQIQHGSVDFHQRV